ncbi:hypothetical protein HAX54_035702 [Datura stramonium]|uniref:RING-type domain-containing protein n=1 Tax=Datura stramonium TaxID=4076 RepID=A0ABS8VJL9_DATST|nr:hypothetical protein [Datura stramonium]
METSLRYGVDSKSLVIHAKEKFPLNTFTHLQGHAELDTRIGAPTYLSAMIRRYFPDQYASLAVGVQYYRRQKLWYNVRGKKTFPVTEDNSVNFHIKGKYNVDEKLLEKKSRGAAEFTWNIMDVKKDQDVRLKVGYEVIEKVPYFQIRENNWTLNVNSNWKWELPTALMSNTEPSHIPGGVKPSSSPSPATASTRIGNVDSDFVVILAALLCALICVLGLVAVARCAWIRRISARATGSSAFTSPPANKGLKKKILKSLPKFGYAAEHAAKFSECAICLAEFAVGDEIRVLPQCGHGFHVGCIDTWLGSHSSCPSCRQILVVTRCHKCGELPVASSSSAPGAEPESRLPRNYHVNAFLP